MRNILPRWRWRYLIILAVLALLLAGALQLPELARQRLEQALAGATGGRAQVEQVAFDPFRLAVTVRGVRLDDALWTRSVHLDALRLVGARGALGLLAEDRLYPRLPGGGDEADQPPPRIRVDRVELVGSALAIRDESAAPSSALRLTDLSLALDGFDSRADTPIAVSLHGRVGAGRLRVEGVLTLASVAFAGTLSATGLAAGPALAYAERALPLHARGGRIDAAAAVHLDDGAVRLSDARIALRGSRITDTADTPLVTVGEVVAEGVDVDLAAQRLVLARLSGSDNWLALGRRADGTLNLAALVDTADADGEAAAPEAGSSPWQIELGELALSDTRIAVTDATLTPPLAQDVTVGQLQVGSLTPGQPTSLALAASLPDGAELAVQGEGQLPAGPARLDISADKLPLPLLARYLPDLGPVMLRSGTLAAQGRLQVDEAGPRFDGQAKLSQLELWDTEREDVPLSLRTLRIDNLAASPSCPGAGAGRRGHCRRADAGGCARRPLAIHAVCGRHGAYQPRHVPAGGPQPGPAFRGQRAAAGRRRGRAFQRCQGAGPGVAERSGGRVRARLGDRLVFADDTVAGTVSGQFEGGGDGHLRAVRDQVRRLSHRSRHAQRRSRLHGRRAAHRGREQDRARPPGTR
jgi:hypothetical protein